MRPPNSGACTTTTASATPPGAVSSGRWTWRKPGCPTGAHGLTELVYAYTSNTNSNGSAMAGFNGATDFHNLLMAVAMPAGRYLPMVCVLALAGRLARQQPGVVTVGTLRAQGVDFVVLATAAAVILALLNFLPALSLGTIADGLM
ncbi:potassium-transporting ATPase subunit KdpA [Streptomyces sp. NPDC058525]|uniref:potassium-transporting ATPase subunit KdpA n=1 Tax=Streptomyces sp. NPDC058525 TaxID=3346538 RepID=UPI003660B751